VTRDIQWYYHSECKIALAACSGSSGSGLSSRRSPNRPGGAFVHIREQAGRQELGQPHSDNSNIC